MRSFTSTSSRCRAPFLKSKLMLPMMSAARVTSLTILDAASHASGTSGASRPSHRKQVLALVTAAEIGCLISCASDAVNSPIVVTLLKCARSACTCRNLALFIRPLAFGHVYRCTDVFQEIVGYVANGVTHRADVLNRSPWKNDSEIHVEVGAFVQPFKNRFSAYPVSILWMNALVKHFV